MHTTNVNISQEQPEGVKPLPVDIQKLQKSLDFEGDSVINNGNSHSDNDNN